MLNAESVVADDSIELDIIKIEDVRAIEQANSEKLCFQKFWCQNTRVLLLILFVGVPARLMSSANSTCNHELNQSTQ